MTNPSAAGLRVALVADNRHADRFRAFLVKQGVDVVFDAQFGVAPPRSWNGAEVLLIAVDCRVSGQRLEGLLAQSTVPVLVATGGLGSGELWRRGLLAKLEGLAHQAAETRARLPADARPGLRVGADGGSAEDSELRVVVLGASIGGPEAVARFLSMLPCDLPLVLLLAQHIHARYQERLAVRLSSLSGWRVAVPSGQERLEPGRMWVLPAKTRIVIDRSGTLHTRAEAWRSTQRPDINAVMGDVANSYGARSGAIMFSGLRGEGAQGCEAIARHGGFVWTQTAGSCALANLPAAVQRSVAVDFSGTPEQLAQQLAVRCGQQAMTIN